MNETYHTYSCIPRYYIPPERIDYYSPIPPAKVLRKAKQTTKKKGKRK